MDFYIYIYFLKYKIITYIIYILFLSFSERDFDEEVESFRKIFRKLRNNKKTLRELANTAVLLEKFDRSKKEL